ncbi:MAG: NDP-sugar synthase [Myxococcota bacterium]|nr:NDP-sugar synthase [Myxococcota bacterium]
MRAMILAAGLGTRMGGLSQICAKPALPVLGRPVIAWLLAWLARQGVTETAINLHHRPETIERAVEEFGPETLRIGYSREAAPLGTGGGIAAMSDFLRQDDAALVLPGDMILDCDLAALVRQHQESGADCTLVLQERSPRNRDFGTIGIDDRGSLRRVAERFDLGAETRCGVFVGLRIVSPSLFSEFPDLPQGTAFEDLSDWWAPRVRAGTADIRGVLLDESELLWQPVGTPAEYLAANLAPPRVSFLDPAEQAAPGTRVIGGDANLVLGPGARVNPSARLRRCVVWAGEEVPAHFQAEGGVFAHGKFYPCDEDSGKLARDKE